MHGYSDRINHAFAFAAKYYNVLAPRGELRLARVPRDREDDRAELLGHLLLEHLPPVGRGILEDVM